jgi:hypothetical protein
VPFAEQLGAAAGRVLAWPSRASVAAFLAAANRTGERQGGTRKRPDAERCRVQDRTARVWR